MLSILIKLKKKKLKWVLPVKCRLVGNYVSYQVNQVKSYEFIFLDNWKYTIPDQNRSGIDVNI